MTAARTNRSDRSFGQDASTGHRVQGVRRLLFPHLALWVLGTAVLRVAIVPPEICPPATAQQVHAAATAAGDWLVHGIGEDARFVYGYDQYTECDRFTERKRLVVVE